MGKHNNSSYQRLCVPDFLNKSFLCEAHCVGTWMEIRTPYSIHPEKRSFLAFQKLYDTNNLKFSAQEKNRLPKVIYLRFRNL